LYVVHRFVLAAEQGQSEWFDLLVGAVKGRMLADALHQELAAEQHGALAELKVYLDGPVLLYLLGYAGPEIQAPYTELMTMISRQGAEARCFDHSLIEAQGILDAAASRVQTGVPRDSYYGDVVAYLVRSQMSRSDIDMRSENLESDLKEAGVVSVDDMPERKYALQVDEDAFEKRLKERFPYTTRTAIGRDIASLTAVHQIRGGKEFRDLGKSRAVFVTHNYALFQEAVRLFDEKRAGRQIPHCIYDASFTTLLWLREPRQAPDLPRERVIADAAAAVLPSDTLWIKYNREIARLQERGELDDAAAAFLRYGEDSRRLLMDFTRGAADALTEGTISQLLDVYNQTVTAELREQLEAQAAAAREAEERFREELARQQAAHEQTRGEIEQIDTRIGDVSATIGRKVGSAIYWGTVLILVIGTAMGPIGLDVVGGFVQVVCAVCLVVALALGVWSVVAQGSVQELRRRSEHRIGETIQRLLRRALR
jgi:hypothetical protein